MSALCGVEIRNILPDELDKLSARDLRMYMEYLGFYVKNDVEITNSELGKMRKLSSLLQFLQIYVQNSYSHMTDQLIDLPSA